MTGCNCLWSPIKTTWRAPEHVIGTRDSSSIHMPHSSTMHCWILSQDTVSLGFPDAVHVQRMIWTPDFWRAQLSASPMSLWKWKKKKHRNKNLQIWHGQLGNYLHQIIWTPNDKWANSRPWQLTESIDNQSSARLVRNIVGFNCHAIQNRNRDHSIN